MKQQPMTADEARENISAMRLHTPENAQIKIIQMALGKFGNLSSCAQTIYRQRLSDLES